MTEAVSYLGELDAGEGGAGSKIYSHLLVLESQQGVDKMHHRQTTFGRTNMRGE